MQREATPRRAALAMGVAAVTALALAACGGGSQSARPAAFCGGAIDPAKLEADAGPKGPAVELVESWPLETTLDHADIPDAPDVWPKMIDGATKTLDIAQFYVSDAPPGSKGRLSPVLDAIERAAKRGVSVRILVEREFVSKYPESLDRLSKVKGIFVVPYAVGPLMGGILHAKYFVVDRREAYLGSQNFDWRSLDHIQEMGVRVRVPEVALALEDVFETDYDLAGVAPKETRHADHTRAWPMEVPDGAGGTMKLTPVATPKGWLPDEASWTLPHLVGLMDGAKKSVHVQVLTYSTTSRDGSSFTTLDDALRRAAARGVEVKLLVSDWATKGHAKESLDALAKVPGISVHVIRIPQASGGPIPFARVAHAKYMVVDGEHAWVGSSNWEGDYFLKTRNVGLVIDSTKVAARLDRVFSDGYAGTYATAW